MENIIVEPEKDLSQMASLIGRYPSSWKQFRALRIISKENNFETMENIFLPAKSIIDSYFGSIEGRAYYCENSLHIICKSYSITILEEAGKQISDFLQSTHDNQFFYFVYDLYWAAEEYAQIVEQDCNRMLFFNSTSKFLNRTTPYDASVHLQKPKSDCKIMTKVLLVEDDPVTRWMVRCALKDECEFACAPTAYKTFSMYSSYNPDIIFLDISLPDDSGYKILQWIIKNDPGAFVVMFSSNNSMVSILEALQKGASGFISKPFLREHLLQYINR